MPTGADIPQSVHSLFPRSTRRLKYIATAWHPDQSTLETPLLTGDDGWTAVNTLATRSELVRLSGLGYTFVSIEVGGRYEQRPIDYLI